jgi:iron complex outermembrane receptor protein
MVARTFIRNRSSIGSNPASKPSSGKFKVSVTWFMARSPWRFLPPIGWVSGHPEITPPTNFHQLRDMTKASWEKFTPKVALSYEPNDDLLLYGLYSRGYRTGRFSERPGTENAAHTPYDPELVDNSEVDMKSEFFDRRLAL